MRAVRMQRYLSWNQIVDARWNSLNQQQKKQLKDYVRKIFIAGKDNKRENIKEVFTEMEKIFKAGLCVSMIPPYEVLKIEREIRFE
jgi:hypothetical protein